MSRFRTIIDILNFLEMFDFSDQAIIEVCRKCYFTRREKKVFEHYPLYLQGRTQSEVGYILGMSQPTISYMLKRCRTKIKTVRNLLESARYHLNVIREKCTPKAYSILLEALAGTRLAKIAKKRKCTVFNISLICSCALKRLRSCPETFDWVYTFLSMLGTVRSNLTSKR